MSKLSNLQSMRHTACTNLCLSKTARNECLTSRRCPQRCNCPCPPSGASEAPGARHLPAGCPPAPVAGERREPHGQTNEVNTKASRQKNLTNIASSQKTVTTATKMQVVVTKFPMYQIPQHGALPMATKISNFPAALSRLHEENGKTQDFQKKPKKR